MKAFDKKGNRNYAVRCKGINTKGDWRTGTKKGQRCCRKVLAVDSLCPQHRPREPNGS